MYNLSLKDYRAIKSADIHIDGITVLAGVNGSGKSTLSRWLYYLINASHEFEQYQRKYFLEALWSEIDKVQRVFRASPKGANYQEISRQFRRFGFDEELDWENLKEVFYSFVNKAEEDLRSYVGERSIPSRLANYLLGKDIPEDMDTNTIIDMYLQECHNAFEHGFNKYMQKIETCRREDLDKVIASEFSDGERIPSSLSLIESDTPLLETDTFSPPLTLSRSIYIDSPMAVSGRPYYMRNDIWENFLEYLYMENPQNKSDELMGLTAQIQSVIGGSILLENDRFGIEKELHYISKEQGIDINIKDAATGVKTFAYMSQLLKNGWLDKETLLLIDEPEAHLHPQWIVEFARLLVKIHKVLGVKMVIASHNPDMVAAIQSIAVKEEVIEDTIFYLAHKEKDDLSYEFVDKGTDIGDIFTSFNIALSRIEQYGTAVI